jgi:hypothetical protein
MTGSQQKISPLEEEQLFLFVLLAQERAGSASSHDRVAARALSRVNCQFSSGNSATNPFSDYGPRFEDL